MSDNYGDRDRVNFYYDSADQVRWRYRSAGNGEVIADSAEGYATEADALTGAQRVTHRVVVFGDLTTFGLSGDQDRSQFIQGVWSGD